ncbi:hypothetical protein [Maritimibacter sp. HL-12]|jgi:hypothetical protein|uniref:hypothetical protein n=1 Tax=Maritimibacter sp. HL-12 TaxID=1162418 RepID=UPI000A0F28C3|nr:hypothetical protein [Maritimibacter sp. HL-12]SMH29724.1 hypothetical protein SAMN05661107_0117 [Maritimibacter sp. HL-12]
MTRLQRENLFRPDPDDVAQEPGAYAVFDMPGAEAPARIHGFDPKRDALHLHLLDAALFGLVPGVWPVATVAYDRASKTTAVAVNGVVVALIEGDPALDPADITVTALT